MRSSTAPAHGLPGAACARISIVHVIALVPSIAVSSPAKLLGAAAGTLRAPAARGALNRVSCSVGLFLAAHAISHPPSPQTPITRVRSRRERNEDGLFGGSAQRGVQHSRRQTMRLGGRQSRPRLCAHPLPYKVPQALAHRSNASNDTCFSKPSAHQQRTFLQLKPQQKLNHHTTLQSKSINPKAPAALTGTTLTQNGN